ncbi:MAG: CAP domain-containing protein [Halanaerobiales bacterium]
MKYLNSSKIAVLLVIVMVANIFIFGVFGAERAYADFWNEHQGSIFTVVKGLVMLWIIRLMTRNSTDNGNDDMITSTIKKGLNIGADELSDNNKSTTPPAEAAKNNVQQENKMVDLINEERKENGLKSLEIDKRLVKAARLKAEDMIDKDYFDHQSPTYGSPFTMIRESGIDFSLAGENLANAETIEQAFSSLLESQKHKDNILKERYDKVGVGVIADQENGFMIVQLFIDSPDPAR